MCGIFCVVSDHSSEAATRVVAGLKRLEYRGYDSWGVAVLQDRDVLVEKHVGKISDTKNVQLPKAQIGIGHTRWATHGGITTANAHPHLASDGSFALAHNGIVQNYAELQEHLKSQGHEFLSETDTEVIVRLIEQLQREHENAEFPDLVRQAFLQLEGRNTIIALTTSGQVVAARHGSPLVLGLADDGDIFVSSDTLSFADVASQMIVVENGQQVLVENGTITLFDVKTGSKLLWEPQPLDATAEIIDKEGFDHFMLKEIHESPTVIEQVMSQPASAMQDLASRVKQARQVYTIGSGTAGVAAAQIAYYLRELSGIPAVSLVGADAVEYYDLIGSDDIIIAPSQSGETADVLEVLEILKEKGTTIVSYVNMQGASMTRLAEYPFLAQAGPEICVMSTKIFVSQIAWGYLLAKAVQGGYQEGLDELAQAAQATRTMLKDDSFRQQIQNLATELAPKPDIFLLGKAQNYQIIREGMIKLIEGSYKHAHAIPAGDLKHYAITLMEEGVPVLVLYSDDRVMSDVLNAAHEVKARGAIVIGFGPKNHQSFDHHLQLPSLAEASALTNVIPLQLLAYYLTIKMGNNVDKPRNIAKSVTVK